MNNTIIHQKEAVSSDLLSDFSDSFPVMSGLVNPDDVRRSLSWMIRPDDTFEIRTFGSQSKPWARTSAGYFKDVETATKALVDHIESFKPGQCYVTLNLVTDDLYARVRDRIEGNQRNTAGDHDVLRYRNILIDHDPVRPAGIPATEDELRAAQDRMDSVKTCLQDQGFPAPLVGMSGNGYHLIYAVDLPVTDDTKRLIKSFLEALASKFDDDHVKIDRSVHNPSRVVKILGTFSRKGDGDDIRTNRLSHVVECPDRIEVPEEIIRAVVKDFVVEQPKTQPETAPKPTIQAPIIRTDAGRVNLQRFLDNRTIGYRSNGQAGKFVLDQCPFNPNHNNGEVAVIQYESGKMIFHCFHNSCVGKHWREFTDCVGQVNQNDFDEPIHRRSADDILRAINGESDQDSGFASYSPDVHRRMAFPTDCLPDGLEDYVVDVAEKTRSPISIVGSTVLGVLAAAVQNVAVVKKAGWDGHQALSMFIFCILESAGGKSRGMRPVMKPFVELQSKQEAQVDRIRQDNKSIVKHLQRQLDQLFRGQDCSNDILAQVNGDGSVIQEARKIQRKIDDLSNPQGGSCLVYDHTVEAALQQMTTTYQRAASLAAESRFVDQALGIAYNTAGSPSLIANAWDGDEIINRRVSRGSIALNHPALTICNGIQPYLFHRNYLNRNNFSDSGFLQRILMVQPESIIAVTGDGHDIKPSLQDAWNHRIHDLASMPIPTLTDGGASVTTVQPHIVTICKDGEQTLRKLEIIVAHLLKRGATTQHPRWRSWIARMVGQVIRIAGLLHAYEHGPDFISKPISGENVDRAVALAAFFKSEADRILNGHSQNPTTTDAEIIREYVVSRRLKRFTVKQLRDNLRRKIVDDEKRSTTVKIKRALDHLRDEGVVGVDSESITSGSWITNPKLLSNGRRN